MAYTTARRRRRSRYGGLPRGLTGRRIAALIAAVIIVPAGVYGARVLKGISDLTGTSVPGVLGCLTKVKCDSRLAGTTQRVNIALYGYGGQGHDGAYLTDSIMVVSIQPQGSGRPARVAEVSVPRDWYVPITTAQGRTVYGRINEVYGDGLSQGPNPSSQYQGDPHGGGRLADDELSKLLGIHIDHFIGVDFHAFQAAVDAVGGVDVVAPDSFTDNQYPHGECDQGDCAYETVHFDAGPQHMDGARALIFSRSRHAYDNPSEGTDFARSRRQQLVLQALKSKVLSVGGIGHLPDLLGALGNHVVTDLSFQDDSALYDLIKGTDSRTFEHISLDDTNFLYECGYPARCSAAYLYTHDNTYQSIGHFMQSLFPADAAIAEHAPVSVVDGSGRGQGASTRWTSLLQAVGFNGSADGGPGRVSSTTRVIDGSGGSDTRTARWLAQYFGTQVETAAAGAPATPTPSALGFTHQGLLGRPSASATTGGITVILGQDEEHAFDSSVGPPGTGGSNGTAAYGAGAYGTAAPGPRAAAVAPRRTVAPAPSPSAPARSSSTPKPCVLTICP